MIPAPLAVFKILTMTATAVTSARRIVEDSTKLRDAFRRNRRSKNQRSSKPEDVQQQLTDISDGLAALEDHADAQSELVRDLAGQTETLSSELQVLARRQIGLALIVMMTFVIATIGLLIAIL